MAELGKPTKRTKMKNKGEPGRETSPRSDEGREVLVAGEVKTQAKAVFGDLMAQTKTKLSKEKGSKREKSKDKDISKELLMESLKKDDVNDLMKANIYDPQVDQKHNSNFDGQPPEIETNLDELHAARKAKLAKQRLRSKERSRKLGADNPAYENASDEGAGVSKKTDKRKSRELDDSRPLKIEDLAPSPQLQQPSPEAAQRKVGQEKKKKKSTKSASKLALSERGRTDQSRELQEASAQADESATAATRDRSGSAKRSRSKKALSKESKPDNAAEAEDNSEEPAVAAKKKKKVKGKKEASAPVAEVVAKDKTTGDVLIDPSSPLGKIYNFDDEGKVLGVLVHRTDKLKTDFFIVHPIVRVHLINEATGEHLLKQSRDRPVTSYYESKRHGKNPETIMPVLTQPFDFKENRAIVPNWEELLIFNENFNYLVHEDPKVMLFFEILDFVSMSRASRRRKKAHGMSKLVEGEGGWHKVAWAFLKLRGANGHLNANMKARLQLYYIPLRLRPHDRSVPVYQYWSWPHREKYPSTLYVTVKSVLPPEDVEPAIRSMFPTQEERGTMTAKEVKDVLEGVSKRDVASVSAVQSALSNWTRLPGQVCKLPNYLTLSLPAGKLGCLVIKFSYDGNYLACGCEDKGSYPILVYKIPGGYLKCTFNGHYNNIYELDWSRSSFYLLSASSDGTARVWSLKSGDTEKLLPHPSFVYSAKFHPRVSRVIVTAGYDHVIRVWQIDFEGGLQGQLVQEIDGHASYVNSVCFNEDGDRLYSGDSLGIIKVWNVYVTERPTKKGVLQDWTLNRDIVDKEIKGADISQLCMHPRGNRMVVHTKDNTVRLLDLRVLSVMQRYVGALNFRERILSDMTPCGTFIFSGSEDGHGYVWSTETGDQVATYSELNYAHAVCDIAFHPHDNIVAFCAHGENHQVLVFDYDATMADANAEKLYEAGPGMRAHLSKATTSDIRVPESKLESLKKSISAKSDLSAGLELKKKQAMRKLDAVMAESTYAFNRQLEKRETGLPHSGEIVSAGRRTPDKFLGLTGTWDTAGWGSTFDSTFDGARQTKSANALLSGKTTSTMAAQLSALRSQAATSGAARAWKPEFSAIGRTGADTAMSLRKTPVIALTPPTPQGSAMFSFQGAAPSIEQREVAVALYDYKAQKSDELTFRRSDAISVLHKDNDNWWIGELANGQQGYFPSNYVMLRKSSQEGNLTQLEEAVTSSYNGGKRTTALIDKKGQLRFLSDDSEDDRRSDNMLTDRSEEKGANESLIDSARRSRSRERRRNKIANSTLPTT